MPDVVGRLRTPRLAGAPAAPAVGELYYDTGSSTLYYWNGTTWVAASAIGGGTPPTRTILTATGTYSPPVGCRAILVECLGGGGGGGGTVGTGVVQIASIGAGGGGGAYATRLIANPATSYAFTIGAGGGGGAAAASTGNPGVVGGDTWFGAATLAASLCGAKGGGPGGAGGVAYGSYGAGDVEVAGGDPAACIGDYAVGGGGSGTRQALHTLNSPYNVLSCWGGAGGAGAVYGTATPGASAGSGVAANGPAGKGRGSGGGGAASFNVATGGAGGNGTAGMIIVTEYYGQLGTGSPTQQVISASGTYTRPLGCVAILVECIGGGGSGGFATGTSAAQSSAGGGGGSGAYTASLIPNPAASYAVVVGAGGPTGGGAGGATSFGSTLVVAGGGAQGATGIASPIPGYGGLGGVGGAATTGGLKIAGEQGGPGLAGANAYPTGGKGGSAPRGGPGGPATTAASGTTPGSTGVVPGGGGSGAANWISAGTGSPGAGAAGQIIVTEYYPGGATGRIVSQAWTVGPPANPQDGDVWMATGVDANGTCWQFRYNAGSASAYKWEFVGGPPAFASVETGESTASGTYVDLATVGPTFTCARGGDYQVMLSSTINNNTLNCGGVYSFDVGAVAAIDNNGLYQVGGPAGINFNFGGKFSLVTGVVAAAVLRGKYRIASGGTATFAYRRMQVTPVRVA